MPLTTLDVEHTLNTLRIELPGASDHGIKQTLWNVIKEFLQDSNSWIEHQHLNVIANKQHYSIVPRDAGQIIRLQGVWDGFRNPINATMAQLGILHVHEKIQVTSVPTTPGQPLVFSAQNPWLIVFVKNIVQPTTKDELPICPKFVLGVYSTYIEAGVMGRMMNQPNKSYSNPAMAKDHLARFKDGINVARNDTFNQNVQGGQRWRYPQQFYTRNQRQGVSTAWPLESF